MYHGHNYPGLFISFEGGEGGGKGTQINYLKNDLERLHIPYDISREPGGIEICEEIRKLLQDNKYSKNIRTELCLYSGARSEFTEHKVIPALKKGLIFIADRFKDSTTAYQGYAGGIDLDFINHMHNYVTMDINPDITFFLDIPPNIGLDRAKKAKQEYEAGDSQESKPMDFHERVRQGYFKIAQHEPDRVKIIDAMKSPEKCYEEIRKYLNPLLLEKYSKTI